MTNTEEIHTHPGEPKKRVPTNHITGIEETPSVTPGVGFASIEHRVAVPPIEFPSVVSGGGTSSCARSRISVGLRHRVSTSRR